MFTLVTLTGTVELQPGVPAPGANVSFQLSQQITDGTTAILSDLFVARCDSNGNFSQIVFANDDPTTTPTGTYYTVTVTIAATITDSWDVIVPHTSAPTVDLFSLARLGTQPLPTVPFVESVNGLNGYVFIVSPDNTIGVTTTGASVELTGQHTSGGSVNAVLPGYAASVGGTAASPIVGVNYGTFDLFGSAAAASIAATLASGSVKTISAGYAASVGGTVANPTVGVQYGVFDLIGSATAAQSAASIAALAAASTIPVGGVLSGNLPIPEFAATVPGTGLVLGTNASVISIANTTVTPGTYGSASQVASVSVNQQGQLLGVVNVPIQIGTSQVTGLGAIATQGDPLGAGHGGTGIANNAANTLTFSGNFGLTLTLSATTALTLPTSGTVTALGNATTGSGSIVLATSPTLTTASVASTPAANDNSQQVASTAYVQNALQSISTSAGGQNMLAWTQDPLTLVSTSSPSTGNCYAVLFQVFDTITITNFWTLCTAGASAGTTTSVTAWVMDTSGHAKAVTGNFFSSNTGGSGTLVVPVNSAIKVPFAATATLAPGFYYFALNYTNATPGGSNPNLWRGADPSAAAVNVGLGSAGTLGVGGRAFSQAGVSTPTVGGSAVPTTGWSNSGAPMWFALS